MEINEHFVEFENFCKYCIYKDTDECLDPCNRCLGEPVNVNSKRPVEFKPTKEFEQKQKAQKERERLASRSRLKRTNTK